MVQVERRAARHVQQRGVLQLAFDLVVAPRHRVGEIVGDVLVELGVLLVLDLRLGSRPQRAGLVDGLPFGRGGLVFAVVLLRHLDGQADVVGVLLDDAAQLPAVGEAFLAFLQVQHDAGAALCLVDRGDLEIAFAGAGPVHALAGGQAGATAEHVHAVGHDEGAVKAHAELSDQVGVLLLVAAEGAQELARAGLGDGAQVRDGLVAAHADAVVVDGDRARVGIEADADAHAGVFLQQLRVLQRLEPQLVGGVGGVGDQLAQEDLLVRVQRVDHQLQQLLHFGLEAQCFLAGFGGHRGGTPWIGWQAAGCGR